MYEIANLSFIVVRTSTGEIKAYPNVCLHRAWRPKDHDGHCSELRCPFHGFAWTLDGALADVPAAWDFPHVAARADHDFHLVECSVGTWAGFVFINPDSHAEPLEAFLGDLPAHFDSWDLENRYVQAHVSKVINANWKVTQEAFCEAYHVGATHPQILVSLGVTNSQVDVWGNFARVITAGGTPSPLLGWAPTEEDIWRTLLDVRVDQQPAIALAEARSWTCSSLRRSTAHAPHRRAGVCSASTNRGPALPSSGCLPRFRSGHVQHGERPAGAGGHVQTGHHPGQLPGSQDPLAAPLAQRVGGARLSGRST